MTFTTLGDLRKTAITFFQKKEIPESILNVDLLLAEVLSLSRVDIYLNFDRPVLSHELDSFRTLSKRRISGEPIQYILGYETFYGLKFNINPSVLIPRPETELLIDIALDKLNTPEIIVDACSGSGAIGIVLAKKFPSSQVIAVEISPAAIETAKKNAAQHNINNIEFLQLDILHTPISNHIKNVDALICNPPYIPLTEKNTLQKEIHFEPSIALFTETGLEFYEKISSEINSILKPNGTLLFEIHSEKENEVKNILNKYQLQEITTFYDLAKLPRAIYSKTPPHL